MFICYGYLILLGSLNVNSDMDITFTTATIRDYTSPKPSTIVRRLNVEWKEMESKEKNKMDVLRNLFLLQNVELRRSRNDVWNWDYWCQLQPKKGNCTGDMQKYYYNAQLDRCLLFDYSGCAGNKNNFKSLIDCERYCKGANYLDLKNTKPPTFCMLQPDSGLCLALITKYYYGVNEGRCKSFKYGGCGGNQNRFDTMAACRRHCFVSTS